MVKLVQSFLRSLDDHGFSQRSKLGYACPIRNKVIVWRDRHCRLEYVVVVIVVVVTDSVPRCTRFYIRKLVGRKDTCPIWILLCASAG